MKKIIKEWREFLVESSLSRVYQHTQEHDTAILTGFRGDPTDTSKCAEEEIGETKKGKKKQANLLRNRNLKAALLAAGYGVTKVDGSYIEDFDTPEAMEVSEDSFFVVNLKDIPDFFSDVESLGRKFCQDSVLMIPQGGKGAYLLGTNNSEFPGLGEKISVGDLKMGEEAEFMTRVGGRPFTATEGLQTYKDLSRNERLAVKKIVEENN